MVVERDEAEPSFLARLPLLHDVNAVDRAVRLKVLAYVVLLRVLPDPAHKDLLHRQVGARSRGVLRPGTST